MDNQTPPGNPEPDSDRQDAQRNAVLEPLIRTGGTIVVLAAALLLAVVETFLVPIRFAQSYLPVAALAAVAGNIVLPLLMLYLARSRGLALLPGLVWFIVVIAATSPTQEGDLLIPNLWPGTAMLLCGAATVAIMGYLTVTGGLGRWGRLVGDGNRKSADS